MIYLPHFLTTKYKTMKKIILASLLFSLTTLVNAAPTGVTLTSTVINENSAAVTTIGTVSTSGDGNGNYSYDVIDPDKITFSFGVERQNGSNSNDSPFKVRPAGGNTDGSNDITIAEIDLIYGAILGPAGILATAINTYNTNNGSGFTASIGENGDDSGALTLTAWPPNLYGAELIGFDTSGGKSAITITSANKTIPTATSATSDFFSIDANGVLKSKVAFNHEEKASYAIVIRATDNDGSYSKDFTIDIINLADTPTDIIPNTTTLSIQENNSIGDIIGTFSTEDGNDGNHTYTLTGENNNLFSIDNNGVLTADIVFDFETQSTYTVTINTDDGTAFHAVYSENFTIYITDYLNEDLTLSSRSVAENNAIGTTVGMLATLGGAAPYTYTIEKNYKTFTFDVGEVDIESTSAIAKNTFIVRTIGGTGINIVGDFEYYAHVNSVSTLWPANVLAFNIDNESDFSAEDIASTSSTGTVQLTDWPDEYDGAELIGSSPTVNGVAIDHIIITSANKTLPSPAPFSIDGNKLITTAVLDQATQGSYTITINSTDANDIVISKDFTITIADGPSGTVTGITLAPNTINNQAADGATVGLLSTNANNTGRVYVLENNTATFSISGDKLTANNPGSLTASATYTVRISTLNGDNTIFTQSLTITVTNDPIFSLDVDGNGTINAPNDGLIIFKYLLNSNANNLHTTIASDTPDGRKTTPQLKAYLDDAGTILDVDGNGTINAPNDGLIIFKYLLNSNANNLHTTIASDAPDGKKTTPQLKAYLDLYSE